MLRKQKWIIMLVVIVGVVALGTAGDRNNANSDEKACKGPGVEEIYESVKNSLSCCQWEETIVNFPSQGLNLVCSLVIPQTRNKPPIVITLNGFTGNRDDGIIPGTNEPVWKRFSRIMAENGIASLRVDFRGSGDSDGEYTMTTFSTQISDALTAVDYITDNLDRVVDIHAIGMFGFSQGGLVGSSAAAEDERVKSLVLESPVANSPSCYGGLLTVAGLKAGRALPDGGTITLGIYVEGQYYTDITLGKGFFQDIFNLDPITEIKSYKNPLMVIVGIHDVIVWPQPEMGQLYLKYHDGCEKLVVLDADHGMDSWSGPEKSDDSMYWATAWFIKTLKVQE